MVSRRSTVSSALLVMVTVLLSLLASAAPSVAAGPTVVYASIPSPLPPNVASVGFQATSTYEFGDDVRLADGPRTLDTVTVVMSSHALAATPANLGAPGANAIGWEQPLTLNVYASSGPADDPVVGTLLATDTDTFHVPWRPVADPTCSGGTAWRAADTLCYNGKAFTVTFDLSASNVTLPSRVIATIAFDTQSYGANPLGIDGPWNSLNFGTQQFGSATVGTDVDLDADMWSSTYGGRTLGLAVDSPSAPYVPNLRITATGPDAAAEVVREAQVAPSLVDLSPAQPWFRESILLGGTAAFQTGPAAPPLGAGSIGLQTTTDGASKANLYTAQYVGTRLDAISSLAYDTYRSSGPAGVVPSLNIEASSPDFTFTTLVFEPINDGSLPSALDGTWQTWDATNDGQGIWWSTRSIPGVNRPADGCSPIPCYVTWDYILQHNPDAQVLRGLGMNVGRTGSSIPLVTAADALAVGVAGLITTSDFEFTPQCTNHCYVSPTGDDANGGNPADPKLTIQAAIDTVTPGGTVHVADGTYAESPDITKSLTLVSENLHGATIELQSGPTYTGGIAVNGQDVTIDGFIIEGRDGSASTLAASNITVLPNLGDVAITNNVIQVGAIGSFSNGDDGIGVLTYWDTVNDTDSLTVTGNTFEPLGASGTRAFFVNPGTNGFLFQDNAIAGQFDRLAVTQAKDGLVEDNTVTGSGASASIGTWGYPDPDAYGQTTFRANTITGTSVGISIRDTNDVVVEHNVISGVVDGIAVRDYSRDFTGTLDGSTIQIHDNSFDAVSGKFINTIDPGHAADPGAVPPIAFLAPITYPTTVDASLNWFGTVDSDALTTGMTDMVDYTPWLGSGDDVGNDLSDGFQGSLTSLHVGAADAALGASEQLGTEGRIQEGIDDLDVAPSGGEVRVHPGTYSETATGRGTDTDTGSYQHGVFFPPSKTGITLQGVTAAGAAIMSSAATQATINTNSTINFGPSGIFVAGDDATIRGLTVGTNLVENVNGDTWNKTIEVIADGFSLLDSVMSDGGGVNADTSVAYGVIYISDFRDPSDPYHVATYHIERNHFLADNSILIASGAGHDHPGDLDDRTIVDNDFDGAPNSLFISFRGEGGRPWYAYPVGGATITGNDFGPADINIRATGIYDEDEFAWGDWREQNTFARLVWVEDQDTGELQTFTYDTFTNVRQLGGRIDSTNALRPAGVDIALAGDTVHVHSGTYPEQAIIDKDDITVEGYGPSKPLVDDGASLVGTGLRISGDDVTVTGVTVQRYNIGVELTGTSDLVGPSDNLLDGVTLTNVDSVDNGTHGLFASALSGMSNLTIDGGNYSRNNVGGPNNNGRGIAVWDGPKTNIVITDVHAEDNRLVGIDINDGSVNGVTVTGNTVTGNGDSGIGVLGPKGPDPNLISDNTVTNNGRFGIEIKIPTANGNNGGNDSTVVSDNKVSRAAGGDSQDRDFAGIAVFRRAVGSLNADQPTGVYVTGNTVSGYRNTSLGDGFGIVVEGTGHTVTLNTVTGNDVGIQAQAGNPGGLPGDATVGNSPAAYFDRGNAGSYGGSIHNNSITLNTTGFRAVGLVSDADVQCNWWNSAAGPSHDAVVAGDPVSTSADFVPWLVSATPLSATCVSIAEDEAPAEDLTQDEGTEFVNDGSFTDTDPLVDPIITADNIIGDLDTSAGNGQWSWTLLADDSDNDGPDSGTITVTAKASNGSIATSTFTYTIDNVAPSGTIVAPTQVAVGDTFPISLTTVEPSAGDVLTWTFQCGAAPVVTVLVDNTTCAAPTSAQVGTNIHVTAQVADDDGGISLPLSQADVLVVAALTLTPNPWPFGSVIVGQSSVARSFTLTNNSNVEYLIDEVGFFVTATSQFQIVDDVSDTCSGLPLLAHASCTFNVVFTPQSTGPKTTTLGVTFTGVQPPLPKPQSALSGTGIAPHATIAGDGAFGTVVVGTTQPATFHIGNDGTSPLHVLSASISGSSRFSVTNDSDCAAPVATGGDTCDIVVTFAPNSADPFNGNLVVLTDGGTVSAPLSGTGLTAPLPAFTVTPASPFDFGNVNVSAPAASQIFKVTNSGVPGTTLQITNVQITGSPTFGETHEVFPAAVTTTLGDSFDITVTFDPTVAGERTATLVITTNVGTQLVSLSGTGTVTPNQPQASADETALDFGSRDIDAGATSAQTVTVTNVGDAGSTLQITGVALTGSPVFLKTHTSPPVNVTSGSFTVDVTFDPSTIGPKNGTLVITTNVGVLLVTLEGIGTATPPAAPIADLEDGPIDFGDVYVGDSETDQVTLTNTGTAPLNVGSISTTGSATFTVEPGQCTAAIPAGGHCDIDVVFTPTTDGTRTGTLHVNTDGGNVSVALEGNGLKPVAEIDPTEGDFGTDTEVGDTKDIDFTVENTGTGTLTFTSITTTGSGTFAVQGSPTCVGASLTTGDCTIRVRFTPTNGSEKNGTLKVVTNRGTLDVPLVGTGVAAPAPEADLSPASRDYGDVVVVTGTKTRTFTLTNTGDADLHVGTIALGGTNPGQFDLDASDCPATLPAGADCDIDVAFEPSTTGHKVATLVVSSDATNGTQTSTFEGDGVDAPPADPIAKVTPDEFDFGNQTVGTDSAPEDFVVKNIGAGTLDVGSVTVNSAFDIDTNGCASAHLTHNQECTISVTFGPGSEGDKEGTLKVPSNAANGTVNVTLEGTGVPAPADVSVSPDDYDFGEVERGTSKNKSFTFSNDGGSPVTVVNVEKASGSGSFVIPPAQDLCSGEIIGAGESCTFRVTFNAPTTTSSKNAVIEVSGTGFSPVTADVHGQSVPFAAKVDMIITKTKATPYTYIGAGIFCTAACDNQTVRQDVKKGTWFTYRIRVKNVGNGRDSIKLRLSQAGSKAIVDSIKVLRDGNLDVTSKVLNEGYVARDLNPGADAYFWVKIKLKSNATVGNSNGMVLNGQSMRQTSVKDVNQARSKAVN